jgi:hypothetical protein
MRWPLRLPLVSTASVPPARGAVYSLRRFAGRTGSLGQPLPDPFESFSFHRITFRQGATSMIAGAPGSFKSVLALNMLAHWAKAGKSALYFSADSDEFTVAKRIGGILTDEATESVELQMQKGNTERYIQAMGALEATQFVYTQSDIEAISVNLRAFEVVYGAFPDVVFVDNLIDTVEDPTDWGGMIQCIKELDGLARETQSHICVLHHASESWAQGNPGKPPPSWAIQGKVNQIPRLVLTTAALGLALSVACVKNTNGPQDPTARIILPFLVQPSMRVDDISNRMGM